MDTTQMETQYLLMQQPTQPTDRSFSTWPHEAGFPVSFGHEKFGLSTIDNVMVSRLGSRRRKARLDNDRELPKKKVVASLGVINLKKFPNFFLSVLL